jgi:hypothetical protein
MKTPTKTPVLRRAVLPPLARVLHRLVRGLEQQALLRIDVRGFAGRDPEKAGSN